MNVQLVTCIAVEYLGAIDHPLGPEIDCQVKTHAESGGYKPKRPYTHVIIATAA
jgi:hypothetical protein